MSEINYGLIESPEDSRDFPLSAVSPDIKRYPEEYPRMFDLTVYNQGSSPSCVGWSCSSIKQYLELKEKHPVEFDGEWLYNECKKIDGIPNFPGTYFRAGLKVLRDKGCKIQGEDNDTSTYRIAEYRRVDDLSFENLKKTIALYGHIEAGFRGDNVGWQGEIVKPPRTNQWSHAVKLTAYEKDYIIGQNSWGTARHNGGFFKVPSNYLPFEAWVITVDKTNQSRGEVQYGWVAATKWTPQPMEVYIANNKVLPEVGLRVREKPTVNSKILSVLPKGAMIRPAIGQDASALDNLQEDKMAEGFQWRCIII